MKTKLFAIIGMSGFPCLGAPVIGKGRAFWKKVREALIAVLTKENGPEDSDFWADIVIGELKSEGESTCGDLTFAVANAVVDVK